MAVRGGPLHAIEERLRIGKDCRQHWTRVAVRRRTDRCGRNNHRKIGGRYSSGDANGEERELAGVSPGDAEPGGGEQNPNGMSVFTCKEGWEGL